MLPPVRSLFTLATLCAVSIQVRAAKPLVAFTENKGQWPAQVLYRAPIPGGALFVEEQALTFVLYAGGELGAHGHDKDHAHEPLRMHAYRVTFEGGQKGRGEGGMRQPYYENYFLGKDPEEWGTGCAVFGEVWVKGIYPGVDLRVDGSKGLKYELHVATGVDGSVISLHYEGQDALKLAGGQLHVKTSAGDVIEEAPIVFSLNTTADRLPAYYMLKDNAVTFDIRHRDPREAIVIDPTYVFGSYSGSTADNFGFTATYDESGHLYGGGIVFGVGYPVTTGVLQPGFGGNTIDCGISKFTPDGTNLVWSTYLGGLFGNESPHSMVVNDNDELYVFGSTGSNDFPTTAGCFDNSFGAGPSVTLITNYGYQHLSGTDVFVAHFSADATALIGSTYVGGSNTDALNVPTATSYNYGDPFRGEIVLDLNGHPVVATSTSSTDMPVTLAGPFGSYQGGQQDGYLFRMDPALTVMEWASYFGGTATDACYGVQVHNTGAIYVTGGSDSPDLPTTSGAFDMSANGGTDPFVASFDASGSPLLACTYTGTGAYDQAYFVQLNQAGEVHIVGQTHGGYPVTPGKFSVANSSQFIHKLNNGLTASLWSTVIGNGNGNEDLAPSAFLVSDCGQIYLSGWGGSVNTFAQAFASTTINFPTTPDAIQTTTDGSDFYLIVLGNDGTTLDYATYFGSPFSSEHVDGGTSRFDKDGIVYQAVCAGCGADSNFPTTPGAWSNTNNSFNCNLGVFKIDLEIGVYAEADATANTGCAPALIQFINTSNGNVYQWDFGDGTAGSTVFEPAHTYDTPGTYIAALIVGDSTGCDIPDTAFVTVIITSPNPITPSFAYAQAGDCLPYQVVFTNTTAGGGLTYSWSMGDGSTYATEDVVHTYPGAGTYTVTLTVNDSACATTATTTQTITITEPVAIAALFTAEQPDPCTGMAVTTVNLSSGPAGMVYTWDMGDGSVFTSNSVVYTYTASGTYTIELTATDTLCDESETFTVDVTVTEAALVDEELKVPNIFSPNGDGENETFFPIPNAQNYVELHVYNRWGQLIYETAGNYRPWDGRVQGNNKPAPDGVYYYLLDYRFPCSGSEIKGREEGYVHIVR